MNKNKDIINSNSKIMNSNLDYIKKELDKKDELNETGIKSTLKTNKSKIKENDVATKNIIRLQKLLDNLFHDIKEKEEDLDDINSEKQYLKEKYEKLENDNYTFKLELENIDIDINKIIINNKELLEKEQINFKQNDFVVNINKEIAIDISHNIDEINKITDKKTIMNERIKQLEDEISK